MATTASVSAPATEPEAPTKGELENPLAKKVDWWVKEGLELDEAAVRAKAFLAQTESKLWEVKDAKNEAEMAAQEVAMSAVGLEERVSEATAALAALEEAIEAAEAEAANATAVVEQADLGMALSQAGLGTAEVEAVMIEVDGTLVTDSAADVAVAADALAEAAEVSESQLSAQADAAIGKLDDPAVQEAIVKKPASAAAAAAAVAPPAEAATSPSAPAPTQTEEEEQASDEKGEKAEKEPEIIESLQHRSSKHVAGAFFSSSPASSSGTGFKDVLNYVLSHGRQALAATALLAVGSAAWFAPFPVTQRLRHKVETATASTLDRIQSIRSPDDAVKAVKGALPEVSEEASGMTDMLYLLGTSVVAVPLVVKLPGGSAVLGFLIGGAVIGPYALGIIQNVHAVKHIAELGVVFLLFNIGLELSYERLRSMAKYVFGMGMAQILLTTAAGTAVAMQLGVVGPTATVMGIGLAFSSTAVALQVLQDRGEAGGRHGRATFAVLLMQDLAVVLVFMLVPLLAPNGTGAPPSGAAIGKALGMALVKTSVAIGVIMSVGRVLVRPLYRRIAKMGNPEIFAATTLLVALGTAELTQSMGLSMALGAFLAGLLIAETEFALQVEEDIAPFRGLLLGLFFMTVGMTIDVSVLAGNVVPILGAIALLIVGKVAVMALIGPVFGLPRLQAIRAGLFLAPGGEFAFVTFGEAIRNGLMTTAMCNQLTLVVALSMAITPYLAMFGAFLKSNAAENTDVKQLLPSEGEADDLNGHVIIAGFGRVGQIIAQLLNEQLIQYVALDLRSDRVAAGRDLDLPVYFGDAGSPGVLEKLGAGRAVAAVLTLDTAGANYRTVYSFHKHFPDCKVFVRAHDVDHGLMLEKAGATAVVPETLEPSLQLASAVLSELDMPSEDVASAVEQFRRRHIAELKQLAESGKKEGQGTVSLGYGETPKPMAEVDVVSAAALKPAEA